MKNDEERGARRRANDPPRGPEDGPETGILTVICRHGFRVTEITNYLEHGGTLEKVQQIATHESPKTTKLYDRYSDAITLGEIERIAI